MPKAVEGQLKFIAENEVVFYVEGRQRIAECGIERVDLLADIGGLINRLAVGVGRGELEPAAGVAGAEFKGVIVRMADCRLQPITAETRPERPARSVHLPTSDWVIHRIFPARAAGECSGSHFARLAEAQAKRRIAGIRFDQYTLTMAGSADITRVKYRVGPSLALNRKHPLFRIWHAVVQVVPWDATDRLISAPADVSVGMGA